MWMEVSTQNLQEVYLSENIKGILNFLPKILPLEKLNWAFNEKHKKYI